MGSCGSSSCGVFLHRLLLFEALFLGLFLWGFWWWKVLVILEDVGLSLFLLDEEKKLGLLINLFVGYGCDLGSVVSCEGDRVRNIRRLNFFFQEFLPRKTIEPWMVFHLVCSIITQSFNWFSLY